jgi:hypothetical protein
MRSHVYVQARLDCDSPIDTSHIAGMTGVYHHTWLLLVEMRWPEHFFALTGLKLQFS